jgi:hypothetical protein
MDERNEAPVPMKNENENDCRNETCPIKGVKHRHAERAFLESEADGADIVVLAPLGDGYPGRTAERCAATLPDKPHKRCSLRPGHPCPHATEGYTWNASDRVDAKGVTTEPWLRRFIDETAHVLMSMTDPDRKETLRRLNEAFRAPRPGETCEAESQSGGFLGNMKCVHVKGHDGPHQTKDGTIWAPMSSETVAEGTETTAEQNLHGRAYALLKALSDVLDPECLSETGASKALNLIMVALNTEVVRTHALYNERPTNKFIDELERHRKAIEEMMPAPDGTTAWMHTLRDAVWFLLAVAHQP